MYMCVCVCVCVCPQSIPKFKKKSLTIFFLASLFLNWYKRQTTEDLVSM